MKISRKQITNAILLLFAAAVFVIIGIKTDWTKTWESIKSAHLGWLGLAAIVMLSAHWIRAARWTILTEPAGYKLNKRRSFYSVMSGYLVNVATSRGGEIARCALSAKSEKAPLELLIGTVVTERLVDFIMLIFVCFAALIFQFQYVMTFLNKFVLTPMSKSLSLNTLIVGLAALVLLVFIIWAFRKNKKKPKLENNTGFKGVIMRFSEGLKTVFKLQQPILFIAYSLGIWVFYWLSTYCVLQSLEVTEILTPLNALSVVVFATIGIAIPLPAGAGVWGAVSLGLQTVYGFDTVAADTYGIFTLAFSNLLMIVFGAISYLLLYIEMQKLSKHDIEKNNQ